MSKINDRLERHENEIVVNLSKSVERITNELLNLRN